MAEIFLSYRRQDSRSESGRLEDDLIEHFGHGKVFRDQNSIPAGEDFDNTIRGAINISTVVLAIIGPDWLSACDQHSNLRLADPRDYVRLELSIALNAGIPVIPVLLEGARMPTEADLPRELASLARCQAVELSSTHWRADTQQLFVMLQVRFAIESVAMPAQGKSEPLNLAERLALDLLEMVAHPRRLIARRRTGHVRDYIWAFQFLIACLVTGNLLMSGSIDWEGLTTFEWIASGLLGGLMMTTLLATPLWFAWWLVDQRVEFRQVLLIFAYLFGAVFLGFAGGLMPMAVGVQITQPGFFNSIREILIESPLPSDQRFENANALIEMVVQQGAALGLGAVSLFLWLLVACWCVAAWGAFRLILHASRLKAIAATTLWLTLLIGIYKLVVWFWALGR
ncbi:toll/interleukin-1 receptor domain-containing protein [Azotobacter chroococcum]|jgi:hypothetical protein|uniref:toll/interleukin-1 receptor domain-containing protein n=1 Tax=Azotobacter chroococcum TaxID=353 RepID=UPI00104027AB|nr:toll/interleukin-1 receptor domain-containing protein [Azotobacter chroococcum]TBW01781.1 toll/interleukin-1 receptor domain-containing protein [Azotobacter chroococcum]